MKVIVTGTGGYLGSLLVPQLLERGHDVTGVDVGFYRSGYLYHAHGNVPRTIVKDTRLLTSDDISGNDALIHMAELSNDPSGELAPNITHKINHEGSVRLAHIAKKSGVKMFIYMSSCSVYGQTDGDHPVTEETPVNPQTAYALCKTLCERDIMKLADKNFSPVFFRNATAYGASPRQRFDLVVNNLSALAWTTNKIDLLSDGSPWRPLVHGFDIGRAICCALDSYDTNIHGQIVNIGSNEQNHRIREVAEIVAKASDCKKITFGVIADDNRSYRVNFDKLSKLLPTFKCGWNVTAGVAQLMQLFENIELTNEDFRFRPYTRMEQLKFLMRTKQIDGDFYWKEQSCRTII